MRVLSKSLAARRHDARERQRLAAADQARISDGLLAKITSEQAVLSADEETMLAVQIEEAKQELYRRRGGADRELQLAHDFGEICE